MLSYVPAKDTFDVIEHEHKVLTINMFSTIELLSYFKSNLYVNRKVLSTLNVCFLSLQLNSCGHISKYMWNLNFAKQAKITVQFWWWLTIYMAFKIHQRKMKDIIHKNVTTFCAISNSSIRACYWAWNVDCLSHQKPEQKISPKCSRHK